MKSIHAAASLSVLGLLAFAACSSDTSSSPQGTNVTGTVDQTTDDSTGLFDESTGATHFRLGVPGPLDTDAIPSGCDYDAALQRFVCAVTTDEHGGTHRRSYAFLDASGAPQSAYDEATTASMSLEGSFDATPELDGESGVVHRAHAFVAEGLDGAETSRRWNGTMTDHSEGVPPHGPGGFGGPRGHGPGGPGGHDGPPPDSTRTPPDFSSLVFDGTTTIAGVVMPHPLGAETWPLSGTITHAVHIEGGPNGTEDRTVTITFNGTRYATLNDGTTDTTIDLKTEGGHGPGPGGPGGPGGHGPRH